LKREAKGMVNTVPPNIWINYQCECGRRIALWSFNEYTCRKCARRLSVVISATVYEEVEDEGKARAAMHV
jgi:hypothetical protein